MACVPISGGALYEDLPAVTGLFSPEDKQRERAGLQLVLVEGEVLNHHGLLVSAGELERGMSRPRRQRIGRNIRPECFGERPKAHSEACKPIINNYVPFFRTFT